MVDISWVHNYLEIDEDVNELTYHVQDTTGSNLLVDNVVDISITAREIQPGMVPRRIFDIIVAYVPDSGSGSLIECVIHRVTTNSDMSTVLITTIDTTLTDFVNMQPILLDQINAVPEYLIFVWSTGNTSPTSYTVSSRRFSFPKTNESGISGLDNFPLSKQSAAIKISTTGEFFMFDGFLITSL